MESLPENERSRDFSWLWGLGLIVLGGVFFLNQFVSLNALIWASVFAGAGVTFFVAYLAAGRHWGLLIPAYVMFFVSLMIVMGTLNFPGGWIGITVVLAIGLPFFYVYLRNNEHWWALIPAYVMLAVAAIIFVSEIIPLPGDWIGAFVMFAIALPFLYVYLRNNENWWALIPAYAMIAVAGIILLSSILPGELIGSYVMFAVALPFFVVFVINTKNWWALIPAGIMATIGVALLISAPATGYIIPVLMLVGGIYLLVRQFAGGGAGETSAPLTGPEADKPKSGPEADK